MVWPEGDSILTLDVAFEKYTWATLTQTALHYAELGDIQQGLGLPGKASLWAKNAFSSTVLKFGH